MASQSNNSGGVEQDPLLEALESIKHLLDQTDLGSTTGAAAGQGTRPQPQARTPAKPAAAASTRRAPPPPGASGELDLPVLDEVVVPGQSGQTGDTAAVVQALRQIQEELSRGIDQTLQQASSQIASRLKQDLQRRIDAVIKSLK